MKIEHFLGLFIIMLLLSACAVEPVIVQDGKVVNERTVSASGNADLKVKPDQAEIRFGIVTQAKFADKAQDLNAEATQAVYKVLNKYISKDDISTEGYNLYQKRHWDYETEKEIFGNYELTHTLKVIVKDLDEVGEVLNAIVKEGVNRLQGVQYTLSDKKERDMKEKALKLATQNAKEKAQILVESLGVSLGTVKTITENNYGYTPYYERDVMVMAESATMKSMPAPSPKEVSVIVTVGVVFNIE